jgi:hypothetical protein
MSSSTHVEIRSRKIVMGPFRVSPGHASIDRRRRWRSGNLELEQNQQGFVLVKCPHAKPVFWVGI